MRRWLAIRHAGAQILEVSVARDGHFAEGEVAPFTRHDPALVVAGVRNHISGTHSGDGPAFEGNRGVTLVGGFDLAQWVGADETFFVVIGVGGGGGVGGGWVGDGILTFGGVRGGGVGEAVGFFFVADGEGGGVEGARAPVGVVAEVVVVLGGLEGKMDVGKWTYDVTAVYGFDPVAKER